MINRHVYVYSISDINGLVDAVNGIRIYEVWLSLCGLVTDKQAVEKCGQHSPIVIFEQDSDLTTPSPSPPRPCSNIGQINANPPAVVNSTNGDIEIRIDYGTTACCFRKTNLTTADVTIVLKKNDCQKQSVETLVTAGNFDMLKNCSESNNHLKIEVNTLVLCDGNIEWRLSLTESKVFCKNEESNHVLCTIVLKRELDGRSVSPSLYCQERLHISIKYYHGREVRMALPNLSMFDSNGTCQFALNSTNVCCIRVMYTNSWTPSRPLKINGTDSYDVNSCKDPHHVWKIVGLIVGVMLIIATIIIIAVFAFKRRRTSKECNLHSDSTNANRSIHSGGTTSSSGGTSASGFSIQNECSESETTPLINSSRNGTASRMDADNNESTPQQILKQEQANESRAPRQYLGLLNSYSTVLIKTF